MLSATSVALGIGVGIDFGIDLGIDLGIDVVAGYPGWYDVAPTSTPLWPI